MRTSSLFHLLLLIAALAAPGCAKLVPIGQELPMHRQVAPLPPGPVCRVAVLPFVNDSDYPLADTLVSKVFMAQFQSSGDHLVVQEGDIAKTYQQLRIMPGEAPSLEQMRIIADRVQAQLLITGIIMKMREERGEHGSANPNIVLDVQIRDARSGEPLWTTFHRRRGTDYQKAMHFGTIHTVSGLSRQMAEEILNLWQEKGLPQCNVSL